MPKIFISIILLLLTSTIFSQEKMLVNDQKTIEATELWSFSNDTYTYSGDLKVQIGNNGNGGTLLIQVETSDPSFKISGTVYLFLDDANVITCTDKNSRTVSGKMIQSFYILTASEINLLKKNKITDVRFRITGNETQFSSPTGFFTAKNKILSFSSIPKSYDTVSAINQIFK
ncbi:hypothetical protein [Flavobacterium tegetincola]|uniref:hypothetical protein n=1 Tax=Flavobacterium tegetincola TaxID=150172 RepID=UPI0004213FC6|nr:hypothetical protein [Flavobacterium tegetincola]